MKKLAFVSFVGLSLASFSQAAVTINIRNFAGVADGIPVVNAAGVPVDQGLAFASVGTFGAGVNFASTTTPAEILALFTPVDTSPVALNANFDGLFSGADMNNVAYSGNIAGSAAYIVIGNAATIAASTMIAVYNLNAVFPTPDAVGNAAVTFSATNSQGFVYGKLVPVTVQPSLANAAFVNGIQLVGAVPEPSVALLGAVGALGILRRRRN